MQISKKTDLGPINVSGAVFAQIIINSIKQEYCFGRVWPATKKGRQIGNEVKYNISDLMSHINIRENEEDGRMELEFSVILQFGTSISKATALMCDSIYHQICEKFGEKPKKIIINVSGIKSKQIARRNLEVVKCYEA